ncbi:hypothetical protein EVAR_85752_1 [Eumeta japonica]|uniref:Uncharacterized protein n=1 Tax=Eumeta variegata TaxID=151549 RepID=A0A4C1ZI77_EUMVA|nr:hypothetical protein EVAR_85752_1 [Eumeta japonica]
MVCVHCSGRHTATSKYCSELDRQKLIKIFVAEESIFYSEASKMHPSIGKSYTNAAPCTLSNPNAQKSLLHTIFLKPHQSTPSPNKEYDKASHQELFSGNFLLIPMAALFQSQALLRVTLNNT